MEKETANDNKPLFKERLVNAIKKKSFIAWMSILVLTVILNILSWCSTSFADWYTDNIFLLIMNIVSRITGIFPFSVGEFMIIAGILLVICVVFATILLPFMRKKWRPFYKFIYPFFAWVLVAVFFVQTCNCFILYHTSTIEEKNFKTVEEEYTFEHLLTIYEHIVKELNALSLKMDRNEKGHIVYDGDIMEEADKAMNALGDEYPRLAGFYPDAKGIIFSEFMSQTYTSGVYFPFSMEANYNTVMYIANNPAVLCHEYAHLKGYIYEDEANFLGYIACVESEDDFFKYSGYLSVLYYIENDLFENIDYVNDETLVDRFFEANPTEIVYDDNIFLTEEKWEEVEEDSIVDTEIADEVSDSFTDTTLKVNGVEDGMESYSRVVRLLLLYYDGKLY
jgi:hypothetical protein